MLTIPHCKESLSRAYISAVVGRARHNLIWHSEFDYGVDGYVRILERRGVRIYQTGLGFDFQSKTTIDWALEGNEIVYDLGADAYNDLVGRAGSGLLPFLLILLCLPKDETVWLNVSSDMLVLKKCAYWIQLDGVLTNNIATRRVRIPVSNVFTPNALSQILEDVKTGEMRP